LVSDDRPAARTADKADVVTERERPVTFRDLFSVSEYRAVYLALLVNWLGDYLARAAITVLVYQQTSSVLLSAASFAVSYLPWLVGGPLLAALAERYPYRRVMVISDLIRMFMIALVAIPGLPVPVILVVLFLGTLASPPTQAARSAILPLLLSRERVIVALAVNATTIQAVQVIGYFAGATIATALNPRLAIAAVAIAFGLSALIIALGVRQRPSASSRAQRTHLLRETGEGFRLVFGHRMLRAIALLVFTLTMFAIVPEGLAAAWAAQGNPDPATRGIDQGMIMAAAPVGWVIGGLAVSRLASPAMRQRLVRPFAVLAPLALVPALTAPSAQIVAVLALLSGVAQGGLMPTLQGMFVLALPHGYRARAYGVMQGGMQLTQGGAVLVTGVLADRTSIPVVVGLWSVGGTLLMAALAAHWPTAKTFDEAIAAAAASAPPPPEAPPETAPETAPRRTPLEAAKRARHLAPEDTRVAAPTRAVVSAPTSAHLARPANLEEADEILRQVQPAEPHWRPQPARPAETRLNGTLNGAQSNATPDPAGDTQDLGRRLEPHPFPSRATAPDGSAMRVATAGGRPPRTMPDRENG
jgi:MFS family permease